MTRNGTAPGLNIECTPALLDYLRQRGAIGQNETPLVRSLEGGVSNRVVLVKRASGDGFVLKQALEKLRVEVEWYCTPERIRREALALRYLADLTPPRSIPALLFEDPAQDLLAMAEVPDPKRNWKQMLLSGDVVRDHIEQFGKLLGTIHCRSAENRKALVELFGDRSIFDALRLEPYYRYTAARVPKAAAFLDHLVADTLACQLSLVHGDYSPKNILVHEGRLVLLDCEVVHFGDPAFDIGFSLSHLLSKANHMPLYRDTLIESAVHYWGSYAAAGFERDWITEMEPRAVRHTIACCLARVMGRSPLEYLTRDESELQTSATLTLLKRPPQRICDLISEFAERLSCRSSKA